MKSPHHGIPTLYRGVQYRSRLEAKWGAFLDLMGWPFQYEPFDLNGWIPDFLVGRGPRSLLVEVKPVVDFPADVARKIDQADDEREILIVGCTLQFPEPGSGETPEIGWLRERYGCLNSGREHWSWQPAAFGSWDGVIGITSIEGSWVNRVGPGQHQYYRESRWVTGTVRAAWDQAGNLVQWRGKQSVSS